LTLVARHAGERDDVARQVSAARAVLAVVGVSVVKSSVVSQRTRPRLRVRAIV
jgi:hypothetical protein